MKRILTLGLVLAACSSSPARNEAAVGIKVFQFSPNPLRVSVGQKVTWTNSDDIAHTVTSGAPGSPAGTFDSGDFIKGRTFSFRFDATGKYDYFCKNHNTMRGRINVS